MPDQIYSNAPRFMEEANKGGFQEVWYLKFNDTRMPRALWLRFTILVRQDRKKEVAEVWAIFSNRTGGKTQKAGLKNTYPLSSFMPLENSGIGIGENWLTERGTAGSLQGDSAAISWNFDITEGAGGGYDFVPASLRRLGLVKNRAVTVFEQQYYTGWCDVNGECFEWKAAPGMQGHLGGSKNGHSWIWGHCNAFVDDSGTPAPMTWDGLSARAHAGGVVLPPLTSMYLYTREITLSFNTVADMLCTKSSGAYDGWKFTAVKSGYRVQGNLRAGLEDYAGVTYEDTDGSNLFCHNSKLSDMTLDVTDPGGGTRRYIASGTAAYEVVSRSPNPSVEFLI